MQECGGVVPSKLAKRVKEWKLDHSLAGHKRQGPIGKLTIYKNHGQNAATDRFSRDSIVNLDDEYW